MRLRTGSTLLLAVVIALSEASAGADEEHRLNLSIVGTKVEFDRTGLLPTRLEGLVFFRGGPSDGGIAGTYEETLKPLTDPGLGLVGTVGESTFRFPRREGAAVTTEEVVTRNRSSIVGEIPSDGALLVESTGRVVKGREPREATGTLRSRAVVRLQPAFQLEVEVSILFGKQEEPSATRPREARRAPGAESLTITLGADGKTEMRYSPAFKKRVLRRLTGDEAVSPAVLSAELGLSEPLLARWAQQARPLAMMRNIPSWLRPAERERSFEEKLGIVLRTAGYAEAELEEFAAFEGISKETIAAWRDSFLTAIESGTRPEGESATGDEEHAEKEAAPLDARALEELKKRMELLEESSRPE